MILKARHIGYVVSLVPFGWNVSLNENSVGRREWALSGVTIPMGGIETKVKAFCRNRGVAYLDLYNVFKRMTGRGKQELFLSADGHWSSRGHLVVAEETYRYFMTHRADSGIPLSAEPTPAAGGQNGNRAGAESPKPAGKFSSRGGFHAADTLTGHR